MIWAIIVAGVGLLANAAATASVWNELRESSHYQRPYLTVIETLNGVEAGEYHLKVLVKNVGQHPAKNVVAYFSAFNDDAGGKASPLFVRRVTSANELMGDNQLVIDHHRPSQPPLATYLVVVSLEYADSFSDRNFDQLFAFTWNGESPVLSEGSSEDHEKATQFAATRHRADGDVSIART